MSTIDILKISLLEYPEDSELLEDFMILCNRRGDLKNFLWALSFKEDGWSDIIYHSKGLEEDPELPVEILDAYNPTRGFSKDLSPKLYKYVNQIDVGFFSKEFLRVRPPMQDFINLKNIVIKGNEGYGLELIRMNKNLELIYIEGCPKFDFLWLSHPEKIVSFSLNHSSNFYYLDLPSIYGLRNLEFLRLVCSHQLNLNPLVILKKLNTLILRIEGQKDFSFLSRMEGLETLTTTFPPGNNILESIQNIETLRHLNLDNHYGDISENDLKIIEKLRERVSVRIGCHF